MYMCRGVATKGAGGCRRGHGPHLQFLNQTAVLYFMGVNKLYGPEISQLLQCMLQFLDNSLMFFLITKGKYITSRCTF